MEASTDLLGEIMKYALRLNMYRDVDVYFCVQGNTGCACLTVEENKTQSYQGRVFLTDKEGIKGILQDIRVMYKEKEKQHAGVLQ